jgi:outer membrane protein TolC
VQSLRALARGGRVCEFINGRLAAERQAQQGLNMRYSARYAAMIGITGGLLAGGCSLTPTQLTPEELSANASDKLNRVTQNQPPLNGRITLQTALEQALKYNLDHHVEIFETSLRTAELNVAHYSMLPNAVANSGYAARDNPSASSSYNLATNSNNFGKSTSTDQRLRASDITFSWHILDFGLSLIRARQSADRVLIAEEGRRKVVHRLLEDVRSAYWRAWSSQELSGRLRLLEARTRKALSTNRAQSADGSTSPITVATYRRELIEVQRTIKELQRDLSVARFQLAALMNVDPASHFTLAAPSEVKQPAMSGGVTELIKIALENRSELRDTAYRQRINKHEADAALLELLPGLQLYTGNNFDSNSFLLNDQWVSWGAKASWNLLKVFQYPARRELVTAQDALLDQKALALTMAIMTQVHVSRVRLAHFERELTTAKDYNETQRELARHVNAEFNAGRVSEQTSLREELTALVAHVRLNITQASVASAKANLLASLGLDPPVVDLPVSSKATTSYAGSSNVQKALFAKPVE